MPSAGFVNNNLHLHRLGSPFHPKHHVWYVLCNRVQRYMSQQLHLDCETACVVCEACPRAEPLGCRLQAVQGIEPFDEGIAYNYTTVHNKFEAMDVYLSNRGYHERVERSCRSVND